IVPLPWVRLPSQVTSARRSAIAIGDISLLASLDILSRAVDGPTLYRWLLVSRVLERALCARNPRWFPAEGEEAAIVGAFCDLRPDDVAAPHYRGPFVVYLMRGAELWRLCA